MKKENRQKNLGDALLKVLKTQRNAFVRTIDGGKIITNHLLYRQMEKESERIQGLIGAENKKAIAKELKGKALTHYEKGNRC